ncbi:MAG: glycerol-3-phosphate dehydrogenase/oxidase [Gammaproteobacteria bacterium]|jgi:glycerol-3-phosphate dehydrogenase|nr:glycerol-3-phosphate dehydrogenase/oxidase [Gammaproteobacteria bacterium]
MQRTTPSTLTGHRFDLLVVGGGIQGAAIAREAALRGLSVLLVEAEDFAGGTSSRSSRLIHGGLRYLREGHVALVREALQERERLLRLAPHLVWPQAMLMPFFEDSSGSRLVGWLGMQAYRLLAGRSRLPGPGVLSARAAVAAFPGLRSRGLRGALQFYDAATVDGRLTLANLEDAARAGARLINHCALVGLAAGGGLRLADRLGDTEITVHARQVVNAAGPRADAVRRLLGQDGKDLVRTTRGSHLVLPPRPTDRALAAFLPDGRIQFVIPHTDGTICGTTDVDQPVGDTEPGVPEADVRYVFDALAWLLDPPPTPQDVRHAWCGLRALPAGNGPPGALNREAFLVTESLPGGKLHTIVGGKLTTHRALAERSINQLFSPRSAGSPSRDRALPGGEGPACPDDPLWARHGCEAIAVRRLCEEEPAWAAPLCPHRPMLGAELVYALREQAAVSFSDVMLRRLWHTQGPCLDEECLRRAHGVFMRERRWLLDDDPLLTLAAVREEVDRLRGAVAG